MELILILFLFIIISSPFWGIYGLRRISEGYTYDETYDKTTNILLVIFGVLELCCFYLMIENSIFRRLPIWVEVLLCLITALMGLTSSILVLLKKSIKVSYYVLAVLIFIISVLIFLYFIFGLILISSWKTF